MAAEKLEGRARTRKGGGAARTPAHTWPRHRTRTPPLQRARCCEKLICQQTVGRSQVHGALLAAKRLGGEGEEHARARLDKSTAPAMRTAHVHVPAHAAIANACDACAITHVHVHVHVHKQNLCRNRGAILDSRFSVLLSVSRSGSTYTHPGTTRCFEGTYLFVPQFIKFIKLIDFIPHQLPVLIPQG